MTLIILTKPLKINFFSLETYKRFLRILTKKKRGPSGVTESLIRGLNMLDYPYKINPSAEDIKNGETVWVNESIDALKYALVHKTSQSFLLAGPNLTVIPFEKNEIICSPKIDIVIQPSLWVKKFVVSLKPTLREKIAIWPAGVEIPKANNQVKDIDVLIYQKSEVSYELLREIRNQIKKNNLKSEDLIYGKFTQYDYFNKLDRTKMVIYLSNSESQGLALQEAWARDVPTLVYNRGFFEYHGYSFSDDAISAPYLTRESGMFFSEENFRVQFEDFIKKLRTFNPKRYVTKNLSDKATALLFIKIIEKRKQH